MEMKLLGVLAGRTAISWPPCGVLRNNNRVFYKPGATEPEVPFSGAVVRVHRIVDGKCVWVGLSDANGYYYPGELELGGKHYAVAIDPTGQHQVTAAGPVVATLEM